MKQITEKIIEVDKNQLYNITFPLGRFGLIVKYHGIKYKFLLNLLENSDKLVVLGSGALSKNSSWDRSRPRFSRWSWDFGESTINFDDPTLYLDDEILIAWSIGNSEFWYLKDISTIIKIIADKLKIKDNKLIFFGSSAGGFTSLMLSTLIKDSISIAENPQFDVTTWGKEHWNVVKKALF